MMTKRMFRHSERCDRNDGHIPATSNPGSRFKIAAPHGVQ
jgi:hypothetical protein